MDDKAGKICILNYLVIRNLERKKWKLMVLFVYFKAVVDSVNTRVL